MSRERILVVEDDQSVGEVMVLALSEVYEVKRATTGAEALSIVRREPVTAVVLDYLLPDATGLDVLGELRSTKPWLPVIMVTGYGSEGVCASALKLGIRDYFPKPLSVFDLRQSLARILSEDRRGSRETFRHEEADRLSLVRFRSQPDPRIQKVAAMIQQRYWDRLTLPALAHEVGMSKYRLSRRFRGVMGVTLRSYLVRVRLEKAQALLTAMQASITEIAMTVGFGDLPRFDKLFKQYTGVTPSSFRNQAPRNQEITLKTSGTETHRGLPQDEPPARSSPSRPASSSRCSQGRRGEVHLLRHRP
jgi:YesN/AraC family two-component response regulator